MRRRLTIAATLALLVVLGLYGAVLAQGGGPIDLNSLPGGGWWVAVAGAKRWLSDSDPPG